MKRLLWLASLLLAAGGAFAQSESNFNNFGGAPIFALTAPTNGQCLTYQSSSKTWINAACGGGGGSGTVTSVALTMPAGFTVSGTPITTAGTFGVTFTGGEPANQFLATPNGSTGPIGLRAIVAADLPTISLTTGVSGTLQAAQFPGLTGDCTTSSFAITCTKTGGVSFGTLATQSGTFSGSSSGTNTGDQTITLTGAVTGSGTGSFATTLATVGVTSGGNGLITATLGDLRYGSGTNTLAALAGNTTSVKQFLTQTGNGTVSAAPAWGAIVAGDLPASVPLLSSANVYTANQEISDAEPRAIMTETDQGTDLKKWDCDIQAAVLTCRTRTDADAAGKNWLEVDRGTTTAVSAIKLGNATDNPTFTWLGTGSVSFGNANVTTGGLGTFGRLVVTATTSPTNGFNAVTTNTIGVYTNSILRAEFDPNYNFISYNGNNATAAGDTNGYLYLNSVAAAPTGTPANTTGIYANNVPLRYDSTHDRLYAYNGGWKALIVNNAATTAAPVVSSCGTTPSIDANASNKSGTVTVGSVAAASCTVTFASSGFTSWNHCRVTSQSTIASFAYSYTKTVLTVTGTSLVGDLFDYDCDGQ